MTEPIDELDSRLLLGRYRVVRRLGEGGMGTVHLARLEGAEGFTRPVVVKRMRSDIQSSDEGHRLFKREAQILSKMQHPGIVNIVDFGVEDGAHIMVLEYVHGYTLAPWLDYRYKLALPLPVDVCLFIVRKVLDALHYAHHFEVEDGQEVQVVHRDVAPDNVLLSKKGYVHLLDFGVASMSGPNRVSSTKSGVFRGKLGYAAPETVNGVAATPRSDLYSAAVLLQELLTQETPFYSDSMGETIQRMVSEIPVPPSQVRKDVPDGLDAALARALAKEPKDRFESAQEFSRELRRLQKHDDDEVAEQLKTLVSADFENLPKEIGIEPLRVREEALSRSMPPGARLRPLESLTGELERGSSTSVASFSSQPNLQETKKLQGLLLGLLLVGGVIALALGAAVALLSRGGSGEQVVVVGGENTRNVLGSDPPSLPKSAALDEDFADFEPQKVDEEEGKSDPLGPNTAAPKAMVSPSKQQMLSQSVQANSAAFQTCFSTHVRKWDTSPQAVLHFSVARGGGKAQIEIEPSSLASSPLGGCLKRAASQVKFPEMEDPVSFRVPVKARVSQVQ